MYHIKAYLRRNVILRYASILLIATFLLLLAIQYILQQTYTEELENNILQSEKKSMENMAMNLDAQMKPYMNVLYDTATAPELLLYLKEIKEGEPLSSKSRMQVQSFLKTKVMYTNKVLVLRVVGESGECIEYDKMGWASNQIKDNFWHEDIMDLYHRVKNTGTVQVSYGEDREYYAMLVHIGIPLVGDHLGKENVFSIVEATLNLDFLYDFFSKSSNDYVENYLVDQNGKILMCRNQSQMGMAFQDIVPKEEFIQLEKTVNRLGWKLYSEIDQTALLQSSSRLTNKVSLIYIVLIVFITVFAIILFRYITDPLRMLAGAMKDIGEGNLGIRMKVKGQDEVWQVVEKFNVMMEKLENYYEVNKQQYQSMLDMQKRKQEAEFEVLESYINSHFIFNTLNVINYQVLEAGNQKASRMIKGLANIMRYAFNSRLQYIYLYQEMLWVEQYLFLQSECTGEKLEFEVLMDEKISECAFRKMILQPFVENSIVHGLKNKKNGRILVQAKGISKGDSEAQMSSEKAEPARQSTEIDQVYILIEDNGCGISAEKQKNILYFLEKPDTMTTEGIGIVNVVTRLRHYFGESVRFRIQSAEGEGTRIEIVIPFMKLQKEGTGVVPVSKREEREI